MSLNGSGVAQINTGGQPVVNGTAIDPTVFNNLTADLATMISTCVMKDGQQTVTANIPLGGFKLTGMSAGTARTDSASLATIQDGTGVYAATVAGTVDVITLTPSPGIAAYVAGQRFYFIAAGANTTNVTVAINGLAAKAITKNGTTALVANDILASQMVTITYDGTRFIIGTHLTADQVTLTGTQTLTNKTLIAPALTSPTITSGVLTALTVAADPVTVLGVASKQYVDGYANVVLSGGKITVTLSANAATIAIKTNAGADPSAAVPVSVIFRSATLTDSAYVVRTITGALSTVISSGSTGGTINATASRIYVGVLDNAGTVELCWWNPVTTTGLFGWSESGVMTTTAEGGAGAADSPGVIYSTTLRTNVAARYAGYFESTQTTAGNWAQAITVLQQMSAGVRRTGDVVQSRKTQTGTLATGTTLIPVDNTIPQITEGDEYMTLAITPTNIINLLTIRSIWNGSNNAAGTSHIAMALFQDAVANALSATAEASAQNNLHMFHLDHRMTAGTVSSTTFRIRVGGDAAGTTSFNGVSGVGEFNGVMNSFMAAIEEFA